LAGIKLMRGGLARMVAGVRATVAVAAVTAALVGMERPLSWWWLIPVVTGVAGWTAFYAFTAWTRGLRAWLIGVDLLLTCLLCLAVGKLVPAHEIPGTLNWVENLASMAVISAQLAGLAAVSVPAGLLVAASMVAGSRLAHSADGGKQAGLILAAQAVLAAMVMAAAMRGERAAVRAFTALEEEQTAAALGAARREDERTRLRAVHNGPLTTLAMALDADAARLSPVLRQRAVAARRDLLELASPPVTGDGVVRLDERLAQVAVWYEQQLKITTALPPCPVPGDVAEAFARAAAEALENVVRYAKTEQAHVELRDDDSVVQVTVTDRGRGFDPALVSPSGFGLREDMPGRMAAVGGAATVQSQPGAGTMVTLEWPRD
jgi:signal transduction histidine kinase